MGRAMTVKDAAPPDLLGREHRHALPDPCRAAMVELDLDVEKVSNSPVVTALLQAVDAVLVVLNEQRQIVAFNDQAARVKAAPDPLGLRPGEALGCVNALVPGGCGASPACETCGALGAVLSSQTTRRPTEAECLLRTEGPVATSLEFHVRATPVLVEGRPFTVMSLRDISGEKRRQALEQIFLHDVLNTVAGLRGWSERLRRVDPGEPAGIRAAERIDVLSRQIEREIRDHRALVLAESGALLAHRTSFPAEELLANLEAVFSSDPIGEGRRLELEAVRGLQLHTDAALLLRVLVNMVRNGLEAVPPGGVVRVWSERLDGGPASPDRPSVRFNVWNDGVIPPAVQARIFQRSFSTKAARGRGLGTYGMKLLGERVLGGEVTFSSEVDSGTVFSITIPDQPARARSA